MIISPDRVTGILQEIAAEEIMPRFNQLQKEDIREKNPGDFVTIADEEVERVLTARLPGLLPGSVVLGEEAVFKNPSVLDLLAGNDPVWVVDPIDGTYNFTHNINYFGILVSLIQNGDIRQSWMHDPNRQRTIHAIKGEGAYLNGEKITLSGSGPTPKTTGNVLETSLYKKPPPEYVTKLKAAGFSLNPVRCSLQDYFELLTGAVDFCTVIPTRKTFRLNVWDHAAGILAIRESGGWAADLDAAPYRPAPPQHNLIVGKNRDTWQAVHKAITG